MTLFWAEKELMWCEIPGTALGRARVDEEIRNVGYLVTFYRPAIYVAVLFKTGLRNGSIQEKFDSRVVEEYLFSLCSFISLCTVLVFHPFLQKILLQSLQRCCKSSAYLPFFVFKTWKNSSAWSLSQLVQLLLVFTWWYEITHILLVKIISLLPIVSK